jgi:hypothetical protein
MEANVEATEVGSLMNGEWYDFDSLYATPQHLTKSSFAARGAQIKTNPNKNREPIKKNRKLQKTEFFWMCLDVLL